MNVYAGGVNTVGTYPCGPTRRFKPTYMRKHFEVPSGGVVTHVQVMDNVARCNGTVCA